MTLQPETSRDVQDIVRQSVSLQVRGAGTKSAHVCEAVVEMTRLSGITNYCPDE